MNTKKETAKPKASLAPLVAEDSKAAAQSRIDKVTKDIMKTLDENIEIGETRKMWRVIVYYLTGTPHEYLGVEWMWTDANWYVFGWSTGAEIAVPANAVWRISKEPMPDPERIIKPAMGVAGGESSGKTIK